MRMKSGSGEKALEGWKEIGAYLQRTERTVRRWEEEEGLPVHRQAHRARVSVYAFPSELDAWRAGKAPESAAPVAQAAPPSMRWRLAAGLSSVSSLAVILLFAGAPPRSLVGTLSAQQASTSGVRVRQVWADARTDGTGRPSRDGKFLSFTDWDTGNGNLGVRNLETGEVRTLTRKQSGSLLYDYAQGSVFSPDGMQIAYEWVDRDGVSEVRVVSAAGGEPRVLVRAKAPFHSLTPVDWSPDGKYLLVFLGPWPKGDNEILLVSAADGSARTLKNLGTQVSGRALFSPDGKFVAYDHPQSGNGKGYDIHAITLELGQEHVLVSHPADDALLGWSPDQASILFSSDRTGSFGMWLLPVEEGRPKGDSYQVRPESGRVRPMGFTSQGAYYFSHLDQGFNIRQAAVDLAAGTALDSAPLLVERYQGKNLEPQYSPDGTRVAFARRAAQGLRLCIFTLASGAELELDPGLSFLRAPRWAPDGKSILVGGTSKQGSVIREIDVASGSTRFECPMEKNSARPPAIWSPDKTAILYSRGLEAGIQAQIVRCDAATKEKTVLLESPKGTFFSMLSVSPDGKRIGLYHWRGKDTAPGFVVAPVSGRSYREVDSPLPPTAFVRDLSWTPDSSQLAVLHKSALQLRSRPELTLLPVEGGSSRTIPLPQGTSGFSLSPDGKKILLFEANWQTQIWVMENFLPKDQGKR